MSQQSLSKVNELKNEILREARSSKQRKTVSWGSWTVSAVLLLLFLFSLVQTIQSINILNKIKSGFISPAAAENPAGNNLPSNLKDLPDMVGGC